MAEILTDYSIYAMFHELLREAGELMNCLARVLVAATAFPPARVKLLFRV